MNEPIKHIYKVRCTGAVIQDTVYEGVSLTEAYKAIKSGLIGQFFTMQLIMDMTEIWSGSIIDHKLLGLLEAEFTRRLQHLITTSKFLHDVRDLINECDTQGVHIRLSLQHVAEDEFTCKASSRYAPKTPRLKAINN